MRMAECSSAAIIAAAWVISLFPIPARAQEPTNPTKSASETNPAVPPPGHSVHGEAFDDGPRRTAHLIPGMGKIHFAVTTSKPEAQKFIDQGVAQLHSFYYFESERSFRQAAKIDPGCAMAYWGMAMSNVNNTNRARGFLKEARKRAGGISPRELLYIAALESFYKVGSNDRARRQGLLQGLETIVQDFPGDIDARAWLAMVTWQNSGEGIGSRQAVDVVLDTVLQVEGMHPGAHHYRIHLWDGFKPLRAEVGCDFCQNGTGHCPRLAHAGPYLHGAQALRRRGLSTGGIGPGRPRVHDSRPRHAIRDSQLRTQQSMALHELEPHRSRAGRNRSGAEPR